MTTIEATGPHAAPSERAIRGSAAGRLAATVSVDVDPVDLHLLGYGVGDAPACALVYERAVPRLVEAFARAGVRATFFFVARDLPAQRAAVAAVAAAGHEVASHSVSHAMAFASLPDEALRDELATSRARLEDACGSEVVGFRAPNWDFDARTARELVRAGYAYDASAYPTPMLLAARLVLLAKGQGASAAGLRFLPFSWSRRVFDLERGALREFPVSVTTWTRFPVYHTAAYLLGERRLVRMVEAVARRGLALSYPLHAVDALGLAEDGVDARLARHPGMDRPLAAKVATLDAVLGAIAARFACIPFRERLGERAPVARAS
ncbi:MAG: polysaccharide deacetylase family protein [Myxococcota bacterium]